MLGETVAELAEWCQVTIRQGALAAGLVDRQDLATPTNPPTAPSNVVAIDMDETNLQALSGAVNGLLFVTPESTLSQQLQTLFGSTGTPAIVAVTDGRGVQSADHTGDGLATVLRFKVEVQFLTPAA